MQEVMLKCLCIFSISPNDILNLFFLPRFCPNKKYSVKTNALAFSLNSAVSFICELNQNEFQRLKKD